MDRAVMRIITEMVPRILREAGHTSVQWFARVATKKTPPESGSKIRLRRTRER